MLTAPALLFAAITVGSCGQPPIVLTYGDSKTVMRKVGNVDDNEDDWQVVLKRELHCKISLNVGTVDGEGWIGTNGITVGQRQDRIDADLAILGASAPTYILLNRRTNDLTAMLQPEGVWKAGRLI